ncbi:hypothetical protein D6792_01660 [Candidatus Parcubacteria bacterium]|nr:MAG: hypothetical protein D6792_01660 [Candidatus Parcubacteria bacterium]
MKEGAKLLSLNSLLRAGLLVVACAAVMWMVVVDPPSAQSVVGSPAGMCADSATNLAELQDIRSSLVSATDIETMQAALHRFYTLQTHNQTDIMRAREALDFERERSQLQEQVSRLQAKDTNGTYAQELAAAASGLASAHNHADLIPIRENLNLIEFALTVGNVSVGSGTPPPSSGAPVVCDEPDCYPWSSAQTPGGPPSGTSPIRDVLVSSASGLRAALQNAQPGDRIIVAPGAYSGTFTISRSGRPDARILIQSQTRGGTTIGGGFVLAGDYITLEGFVFNGNDEVASEGDYNRITRNLIVGAQRRGAIRLGLDADYNRVDHNEIRNYQVQGIYMRTDGGKGPLYAWIDHNYVRDKVPTPASYDNNLEESIQVGMGGLITENPLYAVIEYNLVENNPYSDDTISLKSQQNIVRGNTVLNVKSGIVNRHGDSNTIVANYVRSSSRDITVHSGFLTLLGNDGNIYIGAGNGTTHPHAHDIVAAGNKGRIEVGFVFSNWTPPYIPAERITIEAHEGEVVVREGTSRQVIQRPSTNRTWPAVRKLTPADVGVNAP